MLFGCVLMHLVAGHLFVSAVSPCSSRNGSLHFSHPAVYGLERSDVHGGFVPLPAALGGSSKENEWLSGFVSWLCFFDSEVGENKNYYHIGPIKGTKLW